MKLFLVNFVINFGLLINPHKNNLTKLKILKDFIIFVYWYLNLCLKNFFTRYPCRLH